MTLFWTRDIAFAGARVRGVPEWVLGEIASRYADRKYATRPARWWSDRVTEAMGGK